MSWPAVLIGFLGVVDGILTQVITQADPALEANPIVAWTMGQFGDAWLLPKFAVSLCAATILHKYRHLRHVQVAMWCILLMYTAITVLQIVMIVQAHTTPM